MISFHRLLKKELKPIPADVDSFNFGLEYAHGITPYVYDCLMMNCGKNSIEYHCYENIKNLPGICCRNSVPLCYVGEMNFLIESGIIRLPIPFRLDDVRFRRAMISELY